MTGAKLKRIAFLSLAYGVWALAIPLLVVVGINKFTSWRVILNHTQSMPVGLYVLHMGVDPDTLKIGQIVVVRYQAPKWAYVQNITHEHEYFIKRVGALPGAYVEQFGTKIFRCGSAHVSIPSETCSLMGVRKQQGFDGYKFPTLNLTSPVPAGHVYLRSYYAYGTGFDSRYLGYFKLNQVMGVAYPLWTQIPPKPGASNAAKHLVLSGQ
ncbi:hypothetical protein BJI67_16250 (plasmid) [Acidihalobacter aeolianus]|uniref:Peptidase S26 domain-containing protein n=1 Tax=Acidihalobacter aeolianus TaxID=2792603 RepID=A0A1D8KCW2_9GAMM|nr:S26 family signal peptidase [Acidihalobacter aeolianus]AOV18790.1 hypothetical protein BJI67_16250 [Acidihalobacter aeolianus]